MVKVNPKELSKETKDGLVDLISTLDDYAKSTIKRQTTLIHSA